MLKVLYKTDRLTLICIVQKIAVLRYLESNIYQYVQIIAPVVCAVCIHMYINLLYCYRYKYSKLSFTRGSSTFRSM